MAVRARLAPIFARPQGVPTRLNRAKAEHLPPLEVGGINVRKYKGAYLLYRHSLFCREFVPPVVGRASTSPRYIGRHVEGFRKPEKKG